MVSNAKWWSKKISHVRKVWKSYKESSFYYKIISHVCTNFPTKPSSRHSYIASHNPPPREKKNNNNSRNISHSHHRELGNAAYSRKANFCARLTATRLLLCVFLLKPAQRVGRRRLCFVPGCLVFARVRRTVSKRETRPLAVFLRDRVDGTRSCIEDRVL